MQGLTELVRRLCVSNVEFSIIGGLAAVQHGTSYVTYDLDVCARFTFENLRKIEAAIRDLHPKWRIKEMPFELTEELARGLKNIYLTTDLGKFDCLSEVQAVGDFDAVLKESRKFQFPWGPCYVLDIPALIRAKEAIGRPQDFLVTKQLHAIQERYKRPDN
jgi:hypothetical protein